MSPKQLAQSLRNIGPVVAQKLITAGIDTPEKLKIYGAKEAYMRILRSGGFCGKFHAAYLYALEGAVTNRDWRQLPKRKQEEFKKFTEELRQKNLSNT